MVGRRRVKPHLTRRSNLTVCALAPSVDSVLCGIRVKLFDWWSSKSEPLPLLWISDPFISLFTANRAGTPHALFRRQERKKHRKTWIILFSLQFPRASICPVHTPCHLPIKKSEALGLSVPFFPSPVRRSLSVVIGLPHLQEARLRLRATSLH